MRVVGLFLLVGWVCCKPVLPQANEQPALGHETHTEAELHIGKRAILKGLSKAAEYNGKSGRIRQWSGALGKYYLKLDNVNDIFTVSPENLEIEAEPRPSTEQLETQTLAQVHISTEPLGASLEPNRNVEVEGHHRDIFHDRQTFVSDISGSPLALGNWYHKLGGSTDISVEEWEQLSETERAKYFLVATPQDIRVVKNDNANIAHIKAKDDASRGKVPDSYIQSDAQPQDLIASISPLESLTRLLSANSDQVAPSEQPASENSGHQVYSVSPATRGSAHDHNHNHKAYRSDVSGRVLAIGHWYHKMGDNYDITDDEFKKLLKEDQLKYKRINTRKELDQLLAGEFDKPVLCALGAKLEPGQECVRDAKGHRHVEHLSDVSHQPLLLGKWYHKKGNDYDINNEEFEQLSPDQKNQFERIDTIEDIRRLTQVAPQAAPQEPKVQANAEPADAKAPKSRKHFVTYHSDVSGTVLELGKWYHQLGEDKDISSEEWAHLPTDQRTKFVRIDTPQDIEQIEKEQWVKSQNEMIRAEQHAGVFGMLSETVKRALGSQAEMLTNNLLKYANREETMYKSAKLGLIQHIPSALQHPHHTFAGVRVQPGSDQPSVAVKDSGVTTASGLAVKVAAPPVIPDYVSAAASDEGSLKKQEIPVLSKRAPQGQPISEVEFTLPAPNTPPPAPEHQASPTENTLEGNEPAVDEQPAENRIPYVQDSGYTPFIVNEADPHATKRAPRGKVVSFENVQAQASVSESAPNQ